MDTDMDIKKMNQAGRRKVFESNYARILFNLKEVLIEKREKSMYGR